jgi:hypothetical protein
MVVPALAVVATAAGARQSGNVFLQRRWRSVGGAGNAQNVRLALDVRHRTGFSFASGATGLTVRSFDLDRLTSRALPLTEPGMPLLKPSTPIVVDEAHQVTAVAFAPTEAATVPVVNVYGVVHGRVRRVGQPATRFPAGYALLGMTVDAPRNRMLVLGAPSAGGNAKTVGAGLGNVLLDEWDLGALARGNVTAPAVQPLRVPATCGQVLTSAFAAGILPSPDGKRVFFGCLSNRGFAAALGPNAGDVAGVAELDLAAAATGTPSALRIRPISGDFGLGDSFAIPNLHRMVLTAGSAVTTTIKVFDAAHGYYVGNVGLDSGIVGIGFNATSGRGYYVNGSGLGVFDSAATPVDQGVIYEDFTTALGLLQRGIDVDPRTHRVFISTADDVVNGNDPYIAVFRDRSGPLDDGARTDDQPALDVPEVPGVTDSSRGADAAAVGAELRMVGGPSSLIYNTTHFDSRGILTRPGTRWAQFGVARGVRLTSDEASAEVVTTRYDDASAADANSTELATAGGCSDFGYSPKDVAAADTAYACDITKQRASAGASAEPARVLATYGAHPEAVPAPVQVRSASATVSATRDGTGPLVTTLHAEADGIDLLGAVRIGRVTADAVVTAHGRSGSATTKYDRTVSGLVVNGVTVCATDCPFAAVQNAVAQTFGGRVVVDFPQPYRRAAADGTSALVTDDPYRHVERTTFDDVPDDSVLAPALEVIVYLDGTASSRLVADLASVTSQERYRIYRVGSVETPPPPPPTSVPTVPPVGTTHGGGPGEPPVITDPAGPTPHAVAAQPMTPGELLRRIGEGLKVVFRSPRQLAAVGALWALLAIPVYLAARRRLLLDLPFLRRAMEEST